jgi:hypothetical protein
MLRRLWITFLVTIIKQDSYLQVQLIILNSALMLAYITYVKPFESTLLNNLEIFNELSILFATYHLLCFTQFVSDPEAQYTMGWSLIWVTVLNIAVNICIMTYTSLGNLKLLFKKYKQMYKVWIARRQKKYAMDQEDNSNIKDRDSLSTPC